MYVVCRSEGMRGLSANKHHHRRSADPYFEASGRLYTGLWCLWSELCMRIRRQREPLSLPERPETPSRHVQLHADPSAMAAWMDGSSCSVDDCRLVLSGTGSVKTANQLLLALYAPAKGIGKVHTLRIASHHITASTPPTSLERSAVTLAVLILL